MVIVTLWELKRWSQRLKCSNCNEFLAGVRKRFSTQIKQIIPKYQEIIGRADPLKFSKKWLWFETICLSLCESILSCVGAFSMTLTHEVFHFKDCAWAYIMQNRIFRYFQIVKLIYQRLGHTVTFHNFQPFLSCKQDNELKQEIRIRVYFVDWTAKNGLTN